MQEQDVLFSKFVKKVAQENGSFKEEAEAEHAVILLQSAHRRRGNTSADWPINTWTRFKAR